MDVEISSDGGAAPRSVVAYAELRARAEGPPEDAGYDAVFCVFDRDTHETYEDAKSRVLTLRKERVFPDVAECAITSVPSFEYWFLLHFGYVRAPFSASGGRTVGEVVVGALREIAGFEKYAKAVSSKETSLLLDNTDAAVSNAVRALSDVKSTGEENPSTRVHLVVQYLRSLKEEK